MPLPFTSAPSRSEIEGLLQHSVDVITGHVALDGEMTTPMRDGFSSTAKKIKEMASRYREPFRLAVVGDFKVGKSTLINTLLETDILKEGVVPTTGAITELSWGDEESGVVLDQDGKLIFEGTIADASLYADQRTPQGKQVSKRGARVILRGAFELLRNLVIIDTPGLGASQADDRVTLDALHLADAAILVLSALRPGGENAVELAERLRSTRRQMIVVVTRADQVEEHQRAAGLKEANELFSEVRDGDPISFAAPPVREALAVLRDEANGEQGEPTHETARETLAALGYNALHSRLMDDYFSNLGQASQKRTEGYIAELQQALTGLQKRSTSEHDNAQQIAEKLTNELSDVERKVTQELRPKIPFLDAKIEEVIDKNISEFVADLSEALEIYIDKIADSGITGAAKALWGKLNKSYQRKLKRELEAEFKSLFSDDQLRIVIANIERGVSRLLEMEWHQIAASANEAGLPEPIDTESLIRQIREHLAELAVVMSAEFAALVALLLIPGGVIADLIFYIFVLLHKRNIAGKEDARIARVKREARFRVRGQRRTLVDRLGTHFRQFNQKTAQEVIEKTRAGSSEKQAEKSRQIDLADRWRRAHADLDALQTSAADYWRGEVA